MANWNRRDALWLLGAAALPALAEDPWVAKKPAEWNEKELQRILSDSPWAKPVTVTIGSAAPPAGGGGGGRGRGGRGGGGGVSMPSADNSSGMGGGAMDSGTGGRGGVTNDGPIAAPSIIYTVRWMSALPMRTALVYSKMGAEAATSLQAKAFLEKEDQFYVLSVSGPPHKGEPAPARPRQLTPKLEAEIKEVTTLSWKAHDKVQPLVVQISQTSTLGFTYSFPRTHAIELEDKEVEFATKLGQTVIKRKFKLKDMVYDGKLAL
ncbi:hypothetical protein [uncultured Paludibaculum sp.]|uniref:hypothetical protein n=1 Tax=uncultured Paludibaculum sp. TaxID=1765020 RepID=UPI002AAB9CB5|nr:hypothetical protein [uncultured Paludibaculum sp.]